MLTHVNAVKMPRNVEIKAKIQDLKHITDKAKQLSKSEGEEIKQEDVFFVVPEGRLKLRSFETGRGELIFYNRPDGDGPKLSQFEKCATENCAALTSVLEKALGRKGTVKKTRQLFMVGQTRIHIDHVDKLGDFMELEVMLNDTQNLEEGQLIAEGLMSELGVNKEDLIAGAYMDLLLKK